MSDTQTAAAEAHPPHGACTGDAATVLPEGVEPRLRIASVFGPVRAAEATPVTGLAPVPGVTVGPAHPLSAAYCAERAARAIAAAEQAQNFCDTPGVSGPGALLLAAAKHWTELGATMTANPTMARPRERDTDEPRTARR